MVSAPEKTVKRINKRGESRKQKLSIRKKSGKRMPREQSVREPGEAVPEKRKRAPKKKSSKIEGNTEHLLLTRVLREELNLDNDDNEK